MKKSYCWVSIVFAVLFIRCTSKECCSTEKTPQVKNIIVMIGDGMGVSQVYSGLTANKGTLNLERCQFVGFSKTYSADSYITDSAAGGTAIACGVKTNNGTIGMDPDNKAVKSMLEYAAEAGLSTGIVVSCAATHATPASFYGHQVSRKMEEEIAADFLKTDITVCIAGGRKKFEERADGQNLSEQLKAKGYQVTYTLEDAKKVTSGKLMGFVADEHPAAYPERGDMLPEGVQTAINILKNNEKGFFLMVEGSQIDWACHANSKDSTVNEMLDFDRAVKVAFDYAEQDPHTLVIITADHETGGMALTGGDLQAGEVDARYATGGHSAVMVPVFAYGAGANQFAGIYQNSDILSKVLKLYNFNKSDSGK